MKTKIMIMESMVQRIFRSKQTVKIISFCCIIFSIYGCASLNSGNYKSRIRAVNRVTDQNILYKVVIDDMSFYVQDAAMKRLTDQRLLAKLTVTAIDLKVRKRAVYYITDQKELLNIAQANSNWEVRQTAFKKLNNNSLLKIVNEAKDPALIIAAKIRLGQSSWKEEFSNTNKSTKNLGNVIGAAALVDQPQPTSSDVVTACHIYIRLGDSSRIPELRNLLLRFGDKTLAEDYLNCGKKELADAAREWASSHGYNVRTGSGSHRVRWGGK